MKPRFLLGVTLISATTLGLGAPATRAETVIDSVDKLQQIEENLSDDHVLGQNIDATVTKTWHQGAGFLPLGNATTPFTGTFNGRGYTISGLFISSRAANVGLFGNIGAGGVVTNVGLIGGAVSANSTAYIHVGALAGTNSGTVSSSYSTGNVTGSASLDHSTGGLIGWNSGTVANSYAAGAVYRRRHRRSRWRQLRRFIEELLRDRRRV